MTFSNMSYATGPYSTECPARLRRVADKFDEMGHSIRQLNQRYRKLIKPFPDEEFKAADDEGKKRIAKAYYEDPIFQRRMDEWGKKISKCYEPLDKLWDELEKALVKFNDVGTIIQTQQNENKLWDILEEMEKEQKKKSNPH